MFFQKYYQSVDKNKSASRDEAKKSFTMQELSKEETSDSGSLSEIVSATEAYSPPISLIVDLHRELLKEVNVSSLRNATHEQLFELIRAFAAQSVINRHLQLDDDSLDLITLRLIDEVNGYGPLDRVLRDPGVTDILINGPDKVYIEIAGKLQISEVVFHDERHLSRIVDKIVTSTGRRLDESNPYVDARLKDGSRLNAIIPPISTDGISVSIRKFRSTQHTLQDLVTEGSLSEEMKNYLTSAVTAKLNIVISGGTGSGKTTLLNALSSIISEYERIITIEDTTELSLQQNHVVRLESRPASSEGLGEVTQRDCLKNALRMRPDRIIIGETRGDEAIDMLQAMNTGHDGSMTTIHANSPRDALSRIENLIALSGVSISEKSIRSQISSAINVIIQVARTQSGKRRLISITEITGIEQEMILMQEIFKYENRVELPKGETGPSFPPQLIRSSYLERLMKA